MGDYKIQEVSMIGLGKLGLPIAGAMAKKGFGVTGVDINRKILEAVQERRAPFFEPGLDEILQETSINVTDDIQEAVRQTDASFILVPTPSQKNGAFSLDYAAKAAEQIGRGLREKDYHLVVVSSTVMPGHTQGPVSEILETSSGRKTGSGFGLCYNPEFVAIGDVINGILNPDFVLVGQSDEKAGNLLRDFYKKFCDNCAPVAQMSITEAEIAKIAVNTFVTGKISFANFIARLCEKTPGRPDVDKITRALGLDSRIGPKYLRGAVSYGGPCFPRDNLAITHYAESVCVDACISRAVDSFNRAQPQTIADLVVSKLPENGRVGILGMSYKPDTYVIEESFGVYLAQQLDYKNIPVIVFDPQAMEQTQNYFGDRLNYANSTEACVNTSDVVVVATPWKEFRKLPSCVGRRAGAPQTIIDCWRVFDKKDFEGKADYYALGRGE